MITHVKIYSNYTIGKAELQCFIEESYKRGKK